METVFRGLAIYVVLLLIVRLSGRRTLAQMTPFDLVLLLIIAETTQQALLGDDFCITNAFVLIITLFGIDIALSYLKKRPGGLSLVIDGAPTILLSHGQPDERALRRCRLSRPRKSTFVVSWRSHAWSSRKPMPGQRPRQPSAKMPLSGPKRRIMPG